MQDSDLRDAREHRNNLDIELRGTLEQHAHLTRELQSERDGESAALRAELEGSRCFSQYMVGRC